MTSVLDVYEETSSYNPLSVSTRYGWRHAIKGFETVEAEEIDRKFVSKHRSELIQRGYKHGYIRTRLGYLGSMWQTAIDIQILQENPWRGSLKKLKPSSKKYPQKNFEAFSAFHEDPLFMGLWYHGCRVTELACIEPEDFVLDVPVPYINLEHNKIRSLKNDYTQRQVPMHPKFRKFVEKFPFTTNPKAGDYFSRKLKKHTGISAHGIRHSFITRMRQAGIEYSIAMAIVGHKPVGMTASYGDVLLEDMAKQIQKVS